MDIQMLFDNRNDQQLEDNAEQFNFSSGASDRVSIFDVQALFARLQNNERAAVDREQTAKDNY